MVIVAMGESEIYEGMYGHKFKLDMGCEGEQQSLLEHSHRAFYNLANI